jgi:hypothetical protein
MIQITIAHISAQENAEIKLPQQQKTSFRHRIFCIGEKNAIFCYPSRNISQDADCMTDYYQCNPRATAVTQQVIFCRRFFVVKEVYGIVDLQP